VREYNTRFNANYYSLLRVQAFFVQCITIHRESQKDLGSLKGCNMTPIAPSNSNC